MKAINKFIKVFFIYVSFFPQLIAGPIVRFQEFSPQLLSNWKLNRNIRNIELSVFLFSQGRGAVIKQKY